MATHQDRKTAGSANEISKQARRCDVGASGALDEIRRFVLQGCPSCRPWASCIRAKFP